MERVRERERERDLTPTVSFPKAGLHGSTSICTTKAVRSYKMNRNSVHIY